MDSYSEAHSAILHYSSSLRTIRTVTIAQGFAVLTAAALATSRVGHLSGVVIALFGVVITIVLWFLLRNYEALLITALEHAMEIEANNEDECMGLWTRVREQRGCYKNHLGKFIMNDALHVSFVLAMLGIIAFNPISPSTEQGGAGQPTTALESKPVDKEELNPESKARAQ